MPFWDRFVLALYFGLAQHLPVGRDAALRILDRAIDRGRLARSRPRCRQFVSVAGLAAGNVKASVGRAEPRQAARVARQS